MKKNLLSAFVSLILVSVLAVPAYAVSVAPNSGTVSASSTITVSIVASPNVSNAKAVSLRLTASNGTITGYTSPAESANFLALGVCNDNGAKYTATEVCVDLAKTGTNTVSANESLGSFTIQVGASGTTTINAASDNGYLSEGESNINPQTGQLASYTISTGGGGGTTPTPTTGGGGGTNPTPTTAGGAPTPTGELPKTGITDYPIAAFGGIIAVVFGASLYIYAAKARASVQN